MQVNSVNNYQNFNGAARLVQSAAMHVKNNAMHYYINGVNILTGAVLGNTSADKVMTSKLLLDFVEAAYAVLRNSRTPNGFANLDRPLSNTTIWMGKGIFKFMNKLFPRRRI